MKRFILLAIVGILFLPNIIQSQCAPFHPGYVNIGQFNGHNYYLSIGYAQPTDAQAAAEALGGYLAVIDDEEEDDFILNYIDELTYIGLNDAATEGTFAWFNGAAVGYTNIDPCNFCTSNSDDQDYVVKEPWGAGGWSFSNFWNARKYMVEIPCGTSNTDCAFFNQKEVNNIFDQDVANRINETTDGFELIYEGFSSTVGVRRLTTWNIDKTGQTISDSDLEIPYPTGMDFGRFSTLGDYFFMHDVDGLNPQLVKVDFSGNTVWTKTYVPNTTVPNITYTTSRDAWEDADGILITGHSGEGVTNGVRQPFLIKTDLDGNEIWQQLLANENSFVSLNVLSRSSDGGYYLRLKAGNVDTIIKIDADGNEIWRYGTPVVNSEERNFIGESSDSNSFYFTYADGYFTDDLLLIKLNANDGSFVWERNLGDYFSLTNTSNFGFRLKGAVAADNGGVMFNFSLFGNITSNSFKKYGLINPNGDLVWGYDEPLNSKNLQVVQFATSDGGYLMTGAQSNDKKLVWKYTADGWNAPVCGTALTGLQVDCDLNISVSDLNVNPIDPSGKNITWSIPTGSTDCPGGITVEQLSGPMSSSFLDAWTEYTIVYRIFDACGNEEICTTTIQVEGIFGDVICPDDITVDATSTDGAVVNFGLPTITPSSCSPDSPNQVLGLPSGSVFPIGTTEIVFASFFGGSNIYCQSAVDCSFTITVNDINTGGGCPGDFAGFTTLGEFGDSKYYISNDASRPVDAQAVAEMNGGYLAAISSQEENDFIQQNISEMTYIGLNDYDAEGNLEWFNGEAFTFDNINPCGFCNENSDDQDFVIMAPWNGEWSFSNFYNSRKYVMEVPCGGNGGGDECSFNVTFDASDNGTDLRLNEFQEINGGYQMTSYDLLGTPDFEIYNYLRSKDDGSAISTTVQQLILNSDADGISGYWDKENNVFYSAKIQGGTSIDLRKYDATGNEVWSADVNMSGFDLYNPLRLKSFDDEIIIVCSSGPNDFLVAARTDLFGNLIWKEALNIGADSGTTGSPTQQSADGGYYIEYYDGGPFVAKIDEQGDLEWTANNGTSDPPSEKRAFKGVSGDDRRAYFRRNSFNSFQGFLSVFDTETGALSWSFAAGESFAGGSNAYRSSISNVIPANDGGVVVFYQYHLGFAPTTFINLHERFDADGNLVWSRETPAEVLNFINEETIAAEDGGFIFGKSFSQNPEWTILSMTSEGYFEPDCGGGTGGDLPDLTVSNITNLPSSGNSGDVIFFNFDLNNIGAATASGNYSINIFLSESPTYNPLSPGFFAGVVPTGDTPVGTLDVPAGITVPFVTNGDYYLTIVVDQANFITELDENNNTFVVPFTIGFGGGGCPTSFAGYTSLGEFNGVAYFISDDVSKPLDAQAAAEALGGNLATIDSQSENDFLFPQIDELAYIGLNDYEIENTLEWFSGDPVNFTNFDICGFCNGNSDDMDFVVMHSWNGGWSWSNFFNSRKYIVEIPCGSTLTDPINNNFSLVAADLEIEEDQLSLEKIYPNPTMDNVFVNIISQKDQSLPIEIFDARGILVKTELVSLVSGENTIELQVSNLPDGVYSIFISQIKGKPEAKRFVKVRD